MNKCVSMLACAWLVALSAAPSAAAEPRSGKSDDALARNRAVHAANEQPQPVTGKAGIDRFSVRSENIRESVRADGTVIVELNGEGMEKMMLDESSAVPRAVCASAIERIARTHGFPDDFRGAVRSRGGEREYR